MNFIISYSARVGSSALVDTLKRIPGFKVPVFEDLDWWHVNERGLTDQINMDTIHDHVAALFRDAAQDAGGRLSVGFKWRMWGHLPKLAEMMAASNVMLFNMVRNNIFEMAASLYLTDDVYKDFNSPQFKFNTLKTDAEKAELLDRYRQTVVTADPDTFFRRAESALSAERERIGNLRKLRELGRPVTTIFYEDFAYKRFHFMNRMIGLLGHPRRDNIPMSYMRKISSPFPSDLFSNRDQIANAPAMVELYRTWEDLIYTPEFDVMLV